MIPNKFTLHGTEWNVQIEENRGNTDQLGESICRKCQITLEKLCQNEAVHPDMIEATFFHELVHAFLGVGEYHDLSSDEHLVSHLGNCLHQYLKSKE